MKEKSQEKKDVDLVDVMDIIKRGKLIIAVSVILTLAATFFVTKVFITPVYETSAKILMRGEKLNPKDDFPSYDTGWQFANTQAEIIKSKSVINKAMEKIDFTEKALRGMDSNSLKLNKLKKSLELTMIENTNVLELNIAQENPVFASKLINAIAQTYIENRASMKNKTVDQIIASLQTEIQSAKKDFIDVENELSEIATQEHMIMFSGTDMVLDLQKYADLDMHLISVNADIEMVDVQINAIQQSIKQQEHAEELNLKFIANSDIINNLKSQIRLADLKLELLMSEFNTNHPDVIAAKSAIEILKSDISKEAGRIIKAEVESLETEKKSLISKKDVLLAAYKKQTDRLDKVIKNQPKLAMLNRDIEMKRAVYSDLMAKMQELRVLKQRTSLLPDAEIIEFADTPEHPASPSLIKNLLLGLIVGLTVGFALALMFSVSAQPKEHIEAYDHNGKERRDSARTKTSNKIKCRVVGEKKEHICWSSDMSSSGMKVISNQKLNQNDVVKFEIQQDKANPIAGNGTVVWTSPAVVNGKNNGYAAGIKFYDIQLDINKKKA